MARYSFDLSLGQGELLVPEHLSHHPANDRRPPRCLSSECWVYLSFPPVSVCGLPAPTSVVPCAHSVLSSNLSRVDFILRPAERTFSLPPPHTTDHISPGCSALPAAYPHAHLRRPAGIEHGHGEFLPSVAMRCRHGSRCTFSGRPGPKALAETTAAAHQQPGCQKEVRRGSRALGGAAQDPLGCDQGLAGRENTFALRERIKRKAVWPGRPTSARLRGAENKTPLSPGLRALCQARPLVDSFPARLALGHVVIRAAQSPLRRGPE